MSWLIIHHSTTCIPQGQETPSTSESAACCLTATGCWVDVEGVDGEMIGFSLSYVTLVCWYSGRRFGRCMAYCCCFESTNLNFIYRYIIRSVPIETSGHVFLISQHLSEAISRVRTLKGATFQLLCLSPLQWLGFHDVGIWGLSPSNRCSRIKIDIAALNWYVETGSIRMKKTTVPSTCLMS